MKSSNRSIVCIFRHALILSTAGALLAQVAGMEPLVAQNPSYVVVSAPFAVEKPTEIPGRTLQPGNYSIHIIDRLKDRFILRIDDAKGKQVSTFIGLRDPQFAPLGSLHGPVLWDAAPHGEMAVRGFSFPNGTALEFVYPKSDAVTLAKLNTNSVIAIDPESEGRKPDPKLSPEDREVVTLWMLTATKVGPKEETPAIDVKRFVAPQEPPSSTTADAEASRTPTPPTQTQQAPSVDVSELRTPPPPPRIHAKVKRLPQTASELPLLLLLSVLSLGGAGVLRLMGSRG
jgi:hypothetical protein